MFVAWLSELRQSYHVLNTREEERNSSVVGNRLNSRDQEWLMFLFTLLGCWSRGTCCYPQHREHYREIAYFFGKLVSRSFLFEAIASCRRLVLVWFVGLSLRVENVIGLWKHQLAKSPIKCDTEFENSNYLMRAWLGPDDLKILEASSCQVSDRLPLSKHNRV